MLSFFSVDSQILLLPLNGGSLSGWKVKCCLSLGLQYRCTDHYSPAEVHATIPTVPLSSCSLSIWSMRTSSYPVSSGVLGAKETRHLHGESVGWWQLFSMRVHRSLWAKLFLGFNFVFVQIVLKTFFFFFFVFLFVCTEVWLNNETKQQYSFWT